jgi:5-methylcytosine-specific restriction enzyme subunit McrC
VILIPFLNFEKETEVTIKDELANGIDINIRSYQLPILNRDHLNQIDTKEIELIKIFDTTRIELNNEY